MRIFKNEKQKITIFKNGEKLTSHDQNQHKKLILKNAKILINRRAKNISAPYKNNSKKVLTNKIIVVSYMRKLKMHM